MHLYTTATRNHTRGRDILPKKSSNRSIVLCIKFVTHLCLEQVWTDSEEKGIKKEKKNQKIIGVNAHVKANSI